MKKPKDSEKAYLDSGQYLKDRKERGIVIPFCVGTQKDGQTNRASWWFAGTVKGEEFWKEKNVISSRDY